MSGETSNELSLSPIKRYEYLVKARNFHYENFVKWLSYFYVAIAALFVGFYSIAKEKPFQDQAVLEIAVLILGYIVSLFWYWSSKGYYYWNINFIMLVNYYEKDVFKLKDDERIYSVFANKSIQNNYASPISGANISTSKIAILFGYIVTLFWGFILMVKILDKSFVFHCAFSMYLLAFAASVLSIWVFSKLVARDYLFSDIKHFPDLSLSQKLTDEATDS